MSPNMMKEPVLLEEEEPVILSCSKEGMLVLSNASENEAWLQSHKASIFDVPIDFLNALEQCAPQRFTARVADFNDNLFYDMQEEKGLKHLGFTNSTAMEDIIHTNEFLISFLATEGTNPQPPHVDFPWEFLDEQGGDIEIGFFPLTTEGMYLQVWDRNDDTHFTKIEGEIIYIPFGKLVTLPSDTIHGGGFRSTADLSLHGNLRCHLYIAKNGSQLSPHQTNKYTEPGNKRKELCERYVDAPCMQDLLDSVFV